MGYSWSNSLLRDRKRRRKLKIVTIIGAFLLAIILIGMFTAIKAYSSVVPVYYNDIYDKCAEEIYYDDLGVLAEYVDLFPKENREMLASDILKTAKSKKVPVHDIVLRKLDEADEVTLERFFLTECPEKSSYSAVAKAAGIK